MRDNQLSRYGAIAKVIPFEDLGPQGKVFFVGPSSADWYGDFLNIFGPDSDGGNRVFSGLETALNDANVVANRGDVILLMPGHTEIISSATALNLDKAGVTIVGLGKGSLRPTITLNTATTATLPVSVANITIRNVVFSANFADIVSLFTIAAAKNFRVENCEAVATAANMNFLHIFDLGTVDNSADGLTFLNFSWFEPDALTVAFGLVDSKIDRLQIEGCTLINGAATADIAFLLTVATGKNMTNLRIKRNDCYMTGNAGSVAGLFITTDGTTGTGVIAYNNLKHLDATTELFITATHTFGLFENRSTAVANAQGYLVPVVDA